MNFFLDMLPQRAEKPRGNGLTMMMDKGLGLHAIEDLLDMSAQYIDVVKLGWATSYVTNKLGEKLRLYRHANIPVYFGGTLFEVFLIRNQFDEFLRTLEKFDMTHCEISDGSMSIPHDKKCEYIYQVSKHVTVISEVGSKDAQNVYTPDEWVKYMQAELQAGSWKVIAEARESGSVGIYGDGGRVRDEVIDSIVTNVPQDKIIWEAPHKEQQAWFIKQLGANVNLGNISCADIIPLETLRLGIRSDTFDTFL
ncbi:phosphosulfolactate synthase [Mucilaginibacter ginkgonis]|uniref:Phosphosulfolactate synthase n=1 Tax=Mucilaginibacter ginkgonis TaxID=2682091 RepID=A0A6I4I2M3_9SPHI|nr:phosphosulfolactate synthase [Mucilaginibacter ginkgonis]QQL49017.1 phosphosulfolactate synthase [Mucilaginibacter ginkgonis]